MKKRGVFTKTLLITGTVFAWLPIIAPFIFSAIFMVKTGMFRFDYLMPAELFFFAVFGGLFIIWGGIRSGLGWKLPGIPLVSAIIFWILPQVVATVSGLDSGRTESEGFWMGIVLTLFVVCYIAIIVLGIVGIKFIREVLKKDVVEPPL